MQLGDILQGPAFLNLLIGPAVRRKIIQSELINPVSESIHEILIRVI